MLKLAGKSDSVELKLTVPDEDQPVGRCALGVDPLDAADPPGLLLRHARPEAHRAGVVVRARRVQGARDDTVVKLRPVVPDSCRRSCAVARTSRSRSTRCPAATSARRRSRASRRPARSRGTLGRASRCASCSRRRSERSSPSTRPRASSSTTWRCSGRSSCSSSRCCREGLDRQLVVELWLYPDGSRILELSTKCLPADWFETTTQSRDYVEGLGISLTGAQAAKTRRALEYFAGLQG